MPTLVSYDLNTGVIIWYQTSSESNPVSIGMQNKALESMGLNPDDYGVLLDAATWNCNLMQIAHVVDGQLIQKFDVKDAKTKKKQEILADYALICSGSDPQTGKDIYLDCLTNSGIFRMNAGRDAAANMDYGYKLALEAGLDSLPNVRDFYNTNHANVSLTDANLIRLQQGQDALNHWTQKGQIVDAINAATTIDELETVELAFTVNSDL